jgi:phosphoinositide-3-kinase regulatory subunit 4
MPYLTDIEKKWISYQLIHSLIQIHNKGNYHGDIKPENVLISSTGSVFLADIAPYKPTFINEHDVGVFTYYFGSNTSGKSCYIAPERLTSKKVYDL